MRTTPGLVSLLALCVAWIAAPAEALRAAPPDEPACACVVGQGACQHFLRNPAGPTYDPCWCDRCQTGLQGRRHDGTTVPPGWNPDCQKLKNLACYLKRHAAAYGIACSECHRLDACCAFSNKANCPDCDTPSDGPAVAKDFAGRDARATVAERLAAERKRFKDPKDVMLAYSRHFYVVTDVEGLRVMMPGGIPRPISQHEWIHLMIERAEWCRREWVRKLGEPQMNLPKGTPVPPMAIWLCMKEEDKKNVAAAHLASPNATYLLGNASRPADGFCITGMAYSRQSYGGDHNLHLELRHQLAHNLFSCWGWHETRPASLPQWAFEGLAHWMEKLTPPFADDVTWCVPESARSGVRGENPIEGKEWEKAAARLAASPKLEPIETLLAETVKGKLTQDQHVRAWSLVKLGLEDLGKPFVDLLADLRKERNVKEAFVARIGMTPDELDRRWRERVLGKRASLGGEATPAPAPPPGGQPAETPAARERRLVREEKDPVALAAKIRQQGVIADPDMVEVVVDSLASRHDLVRETALVTLLKVADPACRARLAEKGAAHGDGMARGYAARVCGRLGVAEAAPRLLAQLGDSDWFARAEAAVALGALRHADALPALRRMVTSDASPKAQVGAMDGLAGFGKDAENAVPLVAKHLPAAAWQLRVAAVQTLGRIGSMEGVDPLIARMEIETGRVREEIRDALKAITRDDLGAKPESWRTWWEKEREKHKGSLPPRPASEAPPRTEPDRYGEVPSYYGVELVSDRIAFVVDCSRSMKLLFEPDPAAARLLSRKYEGSDKRTICREEVAQALRTLRQGSSFSVVTFGTVVRSFKDLPVPASKGNIEDAVRFLENTPADGETNYYDSLRAALDLREGPDLSADFRSTPDTITFLTDGEPTAGALTDAAALAEWYTGLNRYARIRTHTVTFGVNRVDQVLLRELATRNGGKFTLIPEKGK